MQRDRDAASAKNFQPRPRERRRARVLRGRSPGRGASRRSNAVGTVGDRGRATRHSTMRVADHRPRTLRREICVHQDEQLARAGGRAATDAIVYSDLHVALGVGRDSPAEGTTSCRDDSGWQLLVRRWHWLLAAPAAAQSQAMNGSIEGTVRDTSGAALPGRDGHRHEHGHRRRPRRGHQRGRRLSRAAAAAGTLQGVGASCRASRSSSSRASRCPRARRR